MKWRSDRRSQHVEDLRVHHVSGGVKIGGGVPNRQASILEPGDVEDVLRAAVMTGFSVRRAAPYAPSLSPMEPRHRIGIGFARSSRPEA